MTTTLAITTFNRTPQLRASLCRLAELTLPDEILVVDDGGSDDCEFMLGEFPNLPIRYIYNHNPGETLYTLARNIGIREATGDLWITTDPEILFETDVIAQLLTLHERHPLHMVQAGTVVNLNEQGLAVGTLTKWVAPHCCLGRREWLLDVGGFDESFPFVWGWDDTDLFTRLRLNGIAQHMAPEVIVRHQWHPSMARHGQHENEAHFKAKSFWPDWKDLTDVVANRDQDWGRIR